MEVRLRQEVKGIEVATAGTALNLQAESLLTNAADTIAKLVQTGRVPQSEPRGHQANFEAYALDAQRHFEQMMGRKSQGIPVWLSIGVIARDKALQRMEIDYGLFVEVPTQIVQEKLRTPANEQAIRNTPPRQDPIARMTSSNEELQQRVTDLERKVDQMVQKLDALTQLLQEKRRDKDEPKK